jgi:hypothetical protein
MSSRAHFWLRIGGVTLILVAQFLPRFVSRDASQSPDKHDKAKVVELANR